MLSRLLSRSEFRDPELAGKSITVTEVRVSPDMRNATAFVTPLTGDAARILPALNRVSGYVRSQLARELTIRYIPAVNFVHDTSFDQAARIDHMLHEPAVAHDLAGDGTRDEADENGA